MIVIFEGPDNTGKDTQQKLLIKNYRNNYFQVLKYSSLPFAKDDWEEHLDYSTRLYNRMFALLASSSTDFILNRSHLGESVYSPLYRNYTGDYVFKLEENWLNLIDENEIFLIVFTNTGEELINRDDGLSFYTNIDEAETENEYFIRAFQKSKIKNKILIEVGTKSREEISKEIINFIEDARN